MDSVSFDPFADSPSLQASRMRRHELLYVDPSKLHIAWRLRCTIRMLVVMDGGGFGGGDFGLQEFLTAFTVAPGPWIRFAVTKAHMGSDSDADIENFEFADHDLSSYDVIWLFGVSRGGSLPAADLRVLAQFMDGGGGVFATGDHEDLGQRMCGRVPRVRSMRKWHWPSPGPLGEPVAPPVGGVGRHDTVMDRGVGQVEFDDQSDDVPQRLNVKLYSTPHPFLAFRTYRYPHPVLCGRDGVIDVFPDHAHEGECYVPTDLTTVLTQDGYACTEYPMDSDGNRIRPEIIASSANQRGIAEKGLVNWRTFGAIGVLDGHRAGVGRVLVDATWHHFFNVNLIGNLGDPNPVQAQGFPRTISGQAALARIKEYFRNTAVWLARKSTHDCIAARGWWFVRWHHRVAMDLPQLDLPLEKISAYEILRIGRIARDVMGKFAPQCQSLAWTLPAFDIDIRRQLLWTVIPPGPLLPEVPEEFAEKYESDPMTEAAAQAVLDGAAGAMIYHLAQAYPDPRSAEKLEDVDFGREMFAVAGKVGVAAAFERVRGARELSENAMRAFAGR
jgi:hypothetical protein